MTSQLTTLFFAGVELHQVGGSPVNENLSSGEINTLHYHEIRDANGLPERAFPYFNQLMSVLRISTESNPDFPKGVVSVDC